MASNRSRVTEHLMRICAARLDPAVTADEFVELLNTLVEWCVEAGRNEGDDDETGPPEKPAPARPAASSGPGTSSSSESSPPTGRGKLSDETRQAIRYEADLQRDDEGKLPRGFVAGLAQEHGVSPQTIYNILAD